MKNLTTKQKEIINGLIETFSTLNEKKNYVGLIDTNRIINEVNEETKFNTEIDTFNVMFDKMKYQQMLNDCELIKTDLDKLGLHIITSPAINRSNNLITEFRICKKGITMINPMNNYIVVFYSNECVEQKKHSKKRLVNNSYMLDIKAPFINAHIKTQTFREMVESENFNILLKRLYETTK